MSEVIETQGNLTIIEVDEGPTTILGVSEQGPPGPQGIPGVAGGSLVQRVAGEVLSALQVVWEDEYAVVRVLDHHSLDIFRVLGVTSTAGGTGDTVTVQIGGVMDDSNWAWTPGDRVYLGAAGGLTNTPAVDGFHVLIGTALSATRVNLNVQDPVEIT